MWHPLAERIGYFKGSVNQGVIIGNSGAILIDTGIDKQAARKLIRLLNELKLDPIAIINTHAHADHFGGNEELLAHYGDRIKVYAPIFEESAIRYPIWEPSYLYGGAYPLSEMENKFLLAPPSRVDVIIEPGKLEIADIELEVVPLYGHSYRQMGIGFENVLFAADGFYGSEVLEKHPIPFHIDTRATLDSLDQLLTVPYDILVPGHGSAIVTQSDRIHTMTQNRLVYEKVNECIVDALQEHKTIDQLQVVVSQKLGVQAANSGSYLLYRTAIQAHLKYLLDQMVITQQIQENQWIWQFRELK